MADVILWDFDGTLIPFDSEQFLLETLPLRGLKALGARLFVHGDRRGWDPGRLKVLYGGCLRGTPLAALDGICTQLAAHISPPDSEALRSLAGQNGQMRVLSCGTANLSQGTLRASGLEDCFARTEANWLSVHDGRIVGIERCIYQPEYKVEIAARYGVPWERVVAVGDGLTDLPLLDHAGLAILIASGEKAAHYAHRGYRIVPTLSAAIQLIRQRFSD